MRESELEREVVKWAESRGGLAVKLSIAHEHGFPDRTILLPERRIVFVELKTPTGRPRYMQEVWIQRLTMLGFPAAICRSLEDVKDLLL